MLKTTTMPPAAPESAEDRPAKADSVRRIGESLPYRDRSEERILEIIEATSDRRDGSDELAAAIVDWPTRYHLTPDRSRLLRPFRLDKDLRILEVGAGCGAVSRYLGETGAQITSLEGDALRARTAAARCEGLDNVEVVCGPLSKLESEQPFDLTVVVGVLEYSGDAAGGGDGPSAFLGRIRELTAPDGALILAIENQLGLKYLLGYPEDHLDRPWVGLEGYLGGERGVRTWSLDVLTQMLRDHGFSAQRRLAAFPDYKTPSTILSERIYEESADQIDALVGPISPYWADPPLADVDERACHRVFLEAGLGLQVANSFLFCAAADEAAVARFLPENESAWLFGGDRRRRWRRVKTVREHADGRIVAARRLHPDDEPVDGWLAQHANEDAPYHLGETLEQLIVDACREHDLKGVREALEIWDRSVRRPRMKEVAANTACDDDAAHPYRRPETRRVLPADHLDLDPANFVLTSDGEVVGVDREWIAEPEIDADLVHRRTMWNLARDLISREIERPWPSTLTIAQLSDELILLSGGDPKESPIDDFFEAEARFLSRVSGQDIDDVLDALQQQSQWIGPPRKAVEIAHLTDELQNQLDDLALSQSGDRRVLTQAAVIDNLRSLFDELETAHHAKEEEFKAAQAAKAEQVKAMKRGNEEAREVYEAEIERLTRQIETLRGEADERFTEHLEAQVHEREAYETQIIRLTEAQKAANEAYEAEIIRLTKAQQTTIGAYEEQIELLNNAGQTAQAAYEAEIELLKVAGAESNKAYEAEIERLSEVGAKSTTAFEAEIKRLNNVNEESSSTYEAEIARLQKIQEIERTEREEENDARAREHAEASKAYEDEIFKLTDAVENLDAQAVQLRRIEQDEREARRLAEESLAQAHRHHSESTAAYEQEIERLQEAADSLETGLDDAQQQIRREQENREEVAQELARAYQAHEEAGAAYEKEIQRINELRDKEFRKNKEKIGNLQRRLVATDQALVDIRSSLVWRFRTAVLRLLGRSSAL